MISINGGGANPEYTYNADGQRVRKKVAGVSTEFVYDLAGNVVAEFVGTIWTRGYVHVVMKGKESLTNYYHLTQRELEKMAQKWGWQ